MIDLQQHHGAYLLRLRLRLQHEHVIELREPSYQLSHILKFPGGEVEQPSLRHLSIYFIDALGIPVSYGPYPHISAPSPRSLPIRYSLTNAPFTTAACFFVASTMKPRSL